MKKLSYVSSCMAMFLLAVNSFSALADTAELPVTANVVSVCHITDSGGIAFGTLDPSTNADVHASGYVDFWCTSDQLWPNITLNDGLHSWSPGKPEMVDAGGNNTILYTAAIGPHSSEESFGGPDDVHRIAVNGTVVFSKYSGAPAGDYTDTLTVTLVAN